MTHKGGHIVLRLGHEGDGVIETAEGVRYVPGVLPGERVLLQGELAQRDPDSISADRRSEPLCPHVEACGGCSLQHMSDETYRRWKPSVLSDALASHGIEAKLEAMIVAPMRSRRRAVLTARREGGDVIVGFHGRRSRDVVQMSACAILSPRIVAALPGLRALALLLLGGDAETHVTVIETAGGLDVAFEAGRRDLSPDTRNRLTELVGRLRLARLSVGGEVVIAHGEPSLAIAGVAVVPPPGAFIQAVAESEAAMAALVGTAAGAAKRVADLFCGLGTFSFALARRAQVLAVDGERPLIEALERGARRASGLKPITCKVRDLFRDPLSPRELEGFDAVLFDPPRAGAKAQAEALAKSTVPTVIAVSCNPATLARDLVALISGGYRLRSVTPVDQFLFSPHLEAVAILERSRQRRR